MRFQTDKPTQIRLVVPEEYQEIFAEFNLLCILQGSGSLVERLGQLALQEIQKPSSRELLRFTWLPWKQFKDEMVKAGYSVSRFAFWEYRKKGLIDDSFVRHDGHSTLYQLEGILGYFKGNNGRASGAPDKV